MRTLCLIFFHIVAKYNKTIDEVRRQEVNKLNDDKEKIVAILRFEV